MKIQNFENEFYIGIRPEDISLENKSEIIEIKIDLIENLGSEKIIYTHINGTEIRIKSTKNIKDKNITIYLPKNKLYLFDNNKNRLKNDLIMIQSIRMATWRNGYAEDCKSFYPSSILGVASKKFKLFYLAKKSMLRFIPR